MILSQNRVTVEILINRRHFARYLGKGVSASSLLSIGGQAQTRKIGYCIVGMGRIRCPPARYPEVRK